MLNYKNEYFSIANNKTYIMRNKGYLAVSATIILVIQFYLLDFSIQRFSTQFIRFLIRFCFFFLNNNNSFFVCFSVVF